LPTHTTKAVETVRLLAISRETATVSILRSVARSNSWHVVQTVSAWDAMDSLETGLRPNLLLLDLPRGDADTLQSLRSLRSVVPDLSVIVICFPDDVERQKQAEQLGARHVLVRPFDEQTLESTIFRNLVPNQLPDSKALGLELLSSPFFVDGLAPQHILEEAKLLAEADVPVLITGEAGTGKGTVARLIHMLSHRSHFEFVTASCDKTPGHALEGELFGNGSSPRLDRRTGSGKIEWAEKGTIFLDEVTDLPLGLQWKVMHLLQDKLRVTHDGGPALPADVRILAATSDDVAKAVRQGKLREDLYHRLSSFTIQIPPLRQRRDEIPVLLDHLMHRLALDWGLPPRPFPAAVIEACKDHSWPGNMQELESFVKRYLVVGRVDLSADADGKLRPAAHNHSAIRGNAQVRPHFHQEVEADAANATSLKSLIRNIRSEAEQKAIRTALDRTGWNRKAAAQLLDVSYRTLLYKIEQYGIRASGSYLNDFPFAGPNGNGKDAKRNGKAS
jgi:two-component system, NtrC family, response regulator AtoC